jgi:2,2-dialkylglycine decarboxylase (pyruvate)
MFDNLFIEAKGCIVRDDTGREILDFTSGQMCATIGHNHPNIVKAIEHAGQTAYHLFSGMIPEAVANLARRIATDWMPAGLNKSLWINTGSESNEAALRMAKMYTGGYEVIAIGGSWHGVTGNASAASLASDRRGYGVPIPGVFAIPEPNAYRPHINAGSEEESAMACLELGLKMFDSMSSGQPAAIISEPILSAGGVLVPPKCFLEGLRKAADERGMLLIFDEAQTAFGRIGTRTGAEYFGVTPDILNVSKTLGGGLPLAGVITTDKIEEVVHDRGYNYYTSHVSDPLPAQVGLAVLNTLEQEDLLKRSKVIGAYLRRRLIELQQRYESIGDIRGDGMLYGIELVKDRETRQPYHELGEVTTKKCYEYGLSMNIKRRKERGSVWRIAPPLTISEDEVDRGIEILDRSLRESLDNISH